MKQISSNNNEITIKFIFKNISSDWSKIFKNLDGIELNKITETEIIVNKNEKIESTICKLFYGEWNVNLYTSNMDFIGYFKGQSVIEYEYINCDPPCVKELLTPIVSINNDKTKWVDWCEDSNDELIVYLFNRNSYYICDIAKAYLEKNKIFETFEILENYITLNPIPDNTYYDIAQIYLKIDKFQEALKLLEKYVTYHSTPKCIDLLLQLDPKYKKSCEEYVEELKKDETIVHSMPPIIKNILLSQKQYILEILKYNKNIWSEISFEMKNDPDIKNMHNSYKTNN